MKLLIASFLFICSVFCYEDDYYWKTFHGAIPRDALPVAEDVYGKVYIGQGICEIGMLVGDIRVGNSKVSISCLGAVSEDITHVLGATNFDNFYWLKTSSATYEADIRNLRVVRTGERAIGRVIINGVVHIGIVAVGDHGLYYSTDGTQYLTNNYEILINGILN